MTHTENTFTERRNPNNHLIESMLNERAQLLTLLLQVDGLTHEELEDFDKELFEEFCQVLVDYIAAGHFGLYQRIIEGNERRAKIAELAEKSYPDIERSTEIALTFNEKYDPEKDNDIDTRELHKELSQLAESIANRIELEDEIISHILA